MKRAAGYAAVMVLLVGVWLGLWAAAAKSQWELLVSFLPVLAVFVFGCACVGRLVWDLLTFNNCPNEIAALEKDIAEAKLDLKKRGFKQDVK